MGVGNSRDLLDDPVIQEKLYKLPTEVMDVALRGMMKMHSQESETLLRILFRFRNSVRECKKILDMNNAMPNRPKRLQSGRKRRAPKKSGRKRDRLFRTTSQASIDIGTKNTMRAYGLDLEPESGMDSAASSASYKRRSKPRRYVDSGFETGVDSSGYDTTYRQVNETVDDLDNMHQEEQIAKAEARKMVDDLVKKDAAMDKEKMRYQEMIQEKLRAKKNRAVDVANNMIKDIDKVNESYAQEKDRQKEKMREMLEEKQRRKRGKENSDFLNV